MAYCIKCGTKNDNDSMFCTRCGTNLGTGTTNKTVKKYKFDFKKHKFDIKKRNTLIIIIVGISIIISISLILLFSNNINRYSNTEDSTVVSDKDAIVISNGQSQIASNQETAKVSISSIPSGANIYINNISRGKTPAIINLPEGDYSLKMNITGYKSIISDFNVTIKPKQDTEIILNATLEQEVGFTNLTNEYTTNESATKINGSTNLTNESTANESTTKESTNLTNG